MRFPRCVSAGPHQINSAWGRSRERHSPRRGGRYASRQSGDWRSRVQTQIPASTSDFKIKEVTFAPYHRPSLNPGRAPAVSVVLLLLEVEQAVSAERPLVVFRIDAGDKFPRSLWLAVQTLRRGSAEREDCASGPPVAAVAVAELVAAVADAAEFGVAAEAAVVAEIEVVVAAVVAFAVEVAAAVAPVAAAALVVATGFGVALAAVTVAVAVVADAAEFEVAAESAVAAVVAFAVGIAAAVAPVAAVALVVATGFAVALAVVTRRSAGKTFPAAERHHY